MPENTQNDKVEQNFRAPFFISDQYVKDLSFENPNFLLKFQKQEKSPQVSVNVETNVAKIHDNHYEVAIKISVKSFVEETDIFLLELVYAGLVIVDPKLTPDILEPVLLVHCPFLMFPFARSIVADLTRNGGYPPLLLEPIDFASLYMNKKQKENPAGNQNEPVKN